MTPEIKEIVRQQAVHIGKTSAEILLVGTWFIAQQKVNSEPRLYVKTYSNVVDVQKPRDTYSGDASFYNVREVGVSLQYWTL